MSRFDFTEDLEDSEDFFGYDVLDGSTDYGGKGETPLPGGKLRRSAENESLAGLNKSVLAHKLGLLNTLDPTKLSVAAVDRFIDRINDQMIEDEIEDLRDIYEARKAAYTGSEPFPDFEVDISKLGIKSILPNLAGTVMDGLGTLGAEFLAELSGVTDRVIEAIETCNLDMDIFRMPGVDINLGILAGLELVLCAATKGDGTLLDAVLNAVDNAGIKRVILQGANTQAARRGNVKALNETLHRTPNDQLVADNPQLPYDFINNLDPYNDRVTREIIPSIIAKIDNYNEWGATVGRKVAETHTSSRSQENIRFTVDNILTVQPVGEPIGALNNTQILKSFIGD